MLGLSFHILSTTSYNNLPPYPARVVNALLIGLKTIILTALKSSLAHALNRETLPLKHYFLSFVLICSHTCTFRLSQLQFGGMTQESGRRKERPEGQQADICEF